MKLKSLIDFNHSVEQMGKEETEVFLKCLLTEMQDQENPNSYSELPDEAFQFLSSSILRQRLQMAEVDVTIPCFIFLANRCRTPAEAVMWAYTACHIAEMKKSSQVSMVDLSHVFPDGFPIGDAMRQCWDAQKRERKESAESDNSLDLPENWEIAV